MSIMKATVDPLSPGSRLDADHPENGVLIPRRITVALPDEVAVQHLQRGPQLARGRDGSAAAGLATEVVHHRADAIDADLRILGLAIPQPPAQALDLLDDHRLRGGALRTIGPKASGNL